MERAAVRTSSPMVSLCYLYNESDVVYIGADKYEIATLTEEKVYLQNAEFPILGQEYSRADFEEKLTENPANDHLKVVVTEKQRTEAPSEKKAGRNTVFYRFFRTPCLL